MKMKIQKRKKKEKTQTRRKQDERLGQRLSIVQDFTLLFLTTWTPSGWTTSATCTQIELPRMKATPTTKKQQPGCRSAVKCFQPSNMQLTLPPTQPSINGVLMQHCCLRTSVRDHAWLGLCWRIQRMHGQHRKRNPTTLWHRRLRH